MQRIFFLVFGSQIKLSTVEILFASYVLRREDMTRLAADVFIATGQAGYAWELGTRWLREAEVGGFHAPNAIPLRSSALFIPGAVN